MYFATATPEHHLQDKYLFLKWTSSVCLLFLFINLMPIKNYCIENMFNKYTKSYKLNIEYAASLKDSDISASEQLLWQGKLNLKALSYISMKRSFKCLLYNPFEYCIKVIILCSYYHRYARESMPALTS